MGDEPDYDHLDAMIRLLFTQASDPMPWTPDKPSKPPKGEDPNPKVPWELSEMDRKFLSRTKIDPENPPYPRKPSDDDGA